MDRVTREIVIEAPPPTVWRHLTDPTERRVWLGGELDVELAPGCEGTFTAPTGTRPVRVDEVDDGRAVTFTWGEDTAASRVTIEVEADGEVSRVRVTETPEADTDAATTEADGGRTESDGATTDDTGDDEHVGDGADTANTHGAASDDPHEGDGAADGPVASIPMLRWGTPARWHGDPLAPPAEDADVPVPWAQAA